MSVLKYIYKKWLALGEIISQIMTPFILFVVFFFFITPLALLYRVVGRDELSLKFNRKKETYWKSLKDKPPLQLEKQF